MDEQVRITRAFLIHAFCAMSQLKPSEETEELRRMVKKAELRLEELYREKTGRDYNEPYRPL